MSNALSTEKSPYLLEHADNPVNWLPWGEAAFEAARTRDVPLFVSVGYSACHWCYVMARESFEDEGVAERLNRDFVPVKVDREERPDVDALLMRACQIMTGSGGWPLTVFLTPDRAPFFAGTYFPREARGGHMGLMTLLERVADAWQDERAALTDAGAALIGHLSASQAAQSGAMDASLFDRARRELGAAFDPKYGGFGRAPKFPSPHVLLFLQRYARQNADDGARHLAHHTLRQMARGGMMDQVGGGFCRYSTDAKWLVPHFEKMLYDNALLMLTYAEAYQDAQDEAFASVAREAADYLLREMRGAHGGFFASQDADTGGREGAYYLFTPEEVMRAVGDGAEALCAYLNIVPGGNFEGQSIPNRLSGTGIDAASIAPARARLYAYRRARMALRTDDKVLTAWNALAIAAFSVTAVALDRPGDLDAARAALRFIDEHLTDGSGGLYARWRDGEAAHRGTLDDYAALGWALIALYDATLDMQYVGRAADVIDQVERRFAAGDGMGYYLSEADAELPVRPRETDDGAMPSGNAMLGYCLARLQSLTGDERHQRLADQQLRFLAGAANHAPAGHAFGLIAGMRAACPETTVTCEAATEGDAAAFRAMLHARFLPQVTAILKPGPRTAYQICHDHACERPLDSLDACAARLDQLSGKG